MMMLLAADVPGIAMPESASTFAGEVDFLWNFIIWVSVFFTVLIAGLMAFFAWRYRMTNPEHKPRGMHHSTLLELGWSVPPLLILIAIFALGFRGYLGMATPPANSYDVTVTAWKWAWQFTYPNGATSNELVVPADTPIRLTLTSRDVIHSFYVPQFRIKKDAVPGRYNQTWFEVPSDRVNWDSPTAGIYDVYCAEYCGTAHSRMLSNVRVLPQEQFGAWVEEAANIGAGLPPAEFGAILYEKKQCHTCHSLTGEVVIGPSFKGLWGERQRMRSGEEVLVDADYLRESILQPNAKIVAGFQPAMPVVPLRETEVEALIAYIKTLGVEHE